MLAMKQVQGLLASASSIIGFSYSVGAALTPWRRPFSWESATIPRRVVYVGRSRVGGLGVHQRTRLGGYGVVWASGYAVESMGTVAGSVRPLRKQDEGGSWGAARFGPIGFVRSAGKVENSGHSGIDAQFNNSAPGASFPCPP